MLTDKGRDLMADAYLSAHLERKKPTFTSHELAHLILDVEAVNLAPGDSLTLSLGVEGLHFSVATISVPPMPTPQPSSPSTDGV